MTISAEPITASIWEDSTPTFLARVKIDSSGTLANVQQADVTSITWKVFLGGTEVGTGTLTVSSVVFNTLQTGTIWDEDSTGYNFKTQLALANFASSGAHRVEFKWTLTGGTVFFLVYNVTVNAVRTS